MRLLARLFGVSACVACWIAGAGPVGAEVRGAFPHENECDIVIYDEITFDDIGSFDRHRQEVLSLARREFSGSPDQARSQWPPTVCLDSRGGSFVAGIEIARLIQNFFGTRLVENSDCFSACAIIFMAGSFDRPQQFFYPSEEGSPYGSTPRPSRSMSTSSRLGFHAPYIDFSEREFIPAAEAQDAIRGALLLTTFLLSETQDNFPLELAREAMSRGPDELFLIDEIGQLNAWGIDLETDIHPELSVALFQRAWITFAHRYANGIPGYGAVGDPAFGVMEALPELWATSGWSYNVSRGVTPSGAAYLQVTNVGREASFGAVLIDYGDEFQLRVLSSDFSIEYARYDIPGWQLLPPTTSIGEGR